MVKKLYFAFKWPIYLTVESEAPNFGVGSCPIWISLIGTPALTRR